MPSPRAQRARDHERRLAQIAAQEAAARRYRRTQAAFGLFGVVVIAAILFALIVAGTRSGNNVATGQSSTTASTASTSSTLPGEQAPKNTAPPVSVPKAPAGESITGDTPCPALDGSAPRVTSFAKPPPMCIEKDRSYDVVIHTTKGDMKLTVANPEAADIVNNFIVLAAYHYYDGMPIDFSKESGWWEVGDYVEGNASPPNPGYTIPYTGPDQLMTSISIGMKIEPGTKNVGGRLVVGFGQLSADIPKGTPSIGLILDGTEASQAIGRAGTVSGAVTEVNKITKIDITPSSVLPSAGSSTTTAGSAAGSVPGSVPAAG